MKKYFVDKRILLVGLGGLGKTYLELLDKVLDSDSRVYVIDSNLDVNYIKETSFGVDVHFVEKQLTQESYKIHLNSYLSEGDILLNLTNTCGSNDLAEYCLHKGIIYQDTAWNWWKSESTIEYSLNEQGEQIQRCKENMQGSRKGVALLNFGINPGLISVVAQKAMQTYKEKFTELHQDTNIVFTEYDAHRADKGSEDLISSWSPYEFWSEFIAPAEYYKRPVFRKSKRKALHIEMEAWSPSTGNYTGFLVPHREVFSFLDSLSEEDRKKVSFSGFCYDPPKGSLRAVQKLLENRERPSPSHSKIIEKTYGQENFDEIGVLVGAGSNWVWAGYSFYLSKRSIHSVSTNSTLYLVAAAAFSGLVACLISKKQGALEAEDLGANDLLKVAEPFIGVPQTHFPSGLDLVDATFMRDLI